MVVEGAGAGAGVGVGVGSVDVSVASDDKSELSSEKLQLDPLHRKLASSLLSSLRSSSPKASSSSSSRSPDTLEAIERTLLLHPCVLRDASSSSSFSKKWVHALTDPLSHPLLPVRVVGTAPSLTYILSRIFLLRFLSSFSFSLVLDVVCCLFLTDSLFTAFRVAALSAEQMPVSVYASEVTNWLSLAIKVLKTDHADLRLYAVNLFSFFILLLFPFLSPCSLTPSPSNRKFPSLRVC